VAAKPGHALCGAYVEQVLGFVETKIGWALGHRRPVPFFIHGMMRKEHETNPKWQSYVQLWYHKECETSNHTCNYESNRERNERWNQINPGDNRLTNAMNQGLIVVRDSVVVYRVAVCRRPYNISRPKLISTTTRQCTLRSQLTSAQLSNVHNVIKSGKSRLVRKIRVE
jgi:hypothetical protein